MGFNFKEDQWKRRTRYKSGFTESFWYRNVDDGPGEQRLKAGRKSLWARPFLKEKRLEDPLMALLFTSLACKNPSPPHLHLWAAQESGSHWGVGPSVPHSCLPPLEQRRRHPRGWQQNTKEAPIRSLDLRVTLSRRLVWFLVSEPRSPAGTIAAACPGGRALGTKPAWSARPQDARADPAAVARRCSRVHLELSGKDKR